MSVVESGSNTQKSGASSDGIVEPIKKNEVEEKEAEVPSSDNSNENSSEEESSEEKTADSQKLSEVDFHKIIKERVAREAAKTAKAEAELLETSEKLKEALESLTVSEKEKLDISEKARIAEENAMKLKVSSEEGIPLKVIETLKWESEDELRAAIGVVKEGAVKKSYSFKAKDYGNASIPADRLLEKIKKR